MPSRCVANFSRVCVEDGTLWFDQHSLCDGEPCREGPVNVSRFPRYCEPSGHRAGMQCVARFLPDWRMARRPLDGVGAESALLPSGIGNTIGRPLTNMAHLLYDHVLHEIDIARAEIGTVLGERIVGELNIVAALRARLLGRATFQPVLSGCFARLYSYAWGCDRSMRRYGTAAAPAFESIFAMRRLMQIHDQRHGQRPSGRRTTMLLYGRSDAPRRRLLNVSAHHAALRARLTPLGLDVLLWDAVWPSRRPSVAAQLEAIRSAGHIVTPHGSFPSVWGLFLRPETALYEIMSACFPYTWLPRHVAGVLRLRHHMLNKWRLPEMQYVDPVSKKVTAVCTYYGRDPDILLAPERLARKVAALVERDHRERDG